jgi:tricarballylate dehydrogenase
MQEADGDRPDAERVEPVPQRFDGGSVTRLDCIPFGIVVNRTAQRFYDEGEDVWPKRYAIWGRLVAGQPDQIAYIIFDATSSELFMPSLYPAIEAPGLGASSEPASSAAAPPPA